MLVFGVCVSEVGSKVLGGCWGGGREVISEFEFFGSR